MRLNANNEAYRRLRATLPSKWLFNLNPDSAFVHQRRKELDTYLGEILRLENLQVYFQIKMLML